MEISPNPVRANSECSTTISLAGLGGEDAVSLL